MAENLLQLCAHGLWPRKHVRREQPDGDIAARERGRVTATVAHLRIPPGVKPAAVAFHDEPPVDDEIDTPDTVDDPLQLRSVAEGAEDQADERFPSRLAARIQETTKHAESRGQSPERLVHTALVDEAEVPGTVERRDGVPRGLTQDSLRERPREVRDERLRGCCRRAPVATYLRRS